MHCYGYALPTTPQLDQLHAQKELAVFTDAVSPSNAPIAALSPNPDPFFCLAKSAGL